MVDLYFPPSTGVCLIAEPGSFFVSSAFTLAVNVISKEVVARDSQDQALGKSSIASDSTMKTWLWRMKLILMCCD